MGEKETIGARVPTSLRERIDTYAEREGVDRSTAITELLRAGLGDDVERSGRPLRSRVGALEEEIEEAGRKIERLESDMETVREEAERPWWWKF